jgi:hypothetical protein
LDGPVDVPVSCTGIAVYIDGGGLVGVERDFLAVVLSQQLHIVVVADRFLVFFAGLI